MLVLTLGAFVMMTSEFVVAGVLPEVAADTGVGVPRAGLLITAFAVGMIVGAPAMALLTLRMSHRRTLVLALAVFALGHAVVGASSSFGVLLAARFVTALAAGAFWTVAAVVATRVAGASSAARAVGTVNAGGLLATVLGVPLGALAAQHVGWRGAFWVLAVLAVLGVVLVARFVPPTSAGGTTTSVRAELRALRSGRLWLTLAACAATMGGVLAAYSYVDPLLTDRAGLDRALVPLVLAGFGVGALLGSLLGGRLGDVRPHLVGLGAPAVSTVLLVGLALTSTAPAPTVVLLVLLGLFGLGANPVLVTSAIRHADHAPTLGSALAAAAFNVGTALGSWVGALALASRLGAVGPVVVGAVLAALTLVPVTLLARARRTTSSAV